ncbi:WG repeat-containing protein [Brumimicrobium glaciale]|uniref:WG repeat-containing protein n=1 Tax=Brumimicrobium glaciale TaxID=200475 RepID=A0A4Q4KNU9_9FLAO|nr:WG repeat-containing protein [Brumimicrobium glaciale]RYM35131.1 WG repeat-containing protein [Brumimicrobium glaciale]
MRYLFITFFLLLLCPIGLSQDSLVKNNYFKLESYHPLGHGFELILDKGYYGLIDSNDNIVCKPKYDRINQFIGDFSIVELDGKMGLINKKGQPVTPVKYERIHPFENNVAFAYFNENRVYVDTNGRVFSYNAPGIGWDFNDGLQPTYRSPWMVYINESHSIILNDGYKQAYPFVNNYAIVQKDRKFHIIDTLGTITKTLKYEYVHQIKDSCYAIVNDGSKNGLIDFKGNEVIPCKYDQVLMDTKGIILVSIGNKWGAYDWNFKKIILPVFDKIRYAKTERGYSESPIPGHDKVVVEMNNKKGIIDYRGKTIKACEYDDIQFHDDFSIITVKQNPNRDNGINVFENNFKGYELSDKDGKLLTKKKFEYLVQLNSRYYAFSELLGKYEQYEWQKIGLDNIKQDNSIYYTNRSLFDLQQNKKILGQFTDFRLIGENIFAVRDTIAKPRGMLTREKIKEFYSNNPPLPNANEWKLIDKRGNQIAIPDGLIIDEPYYNHITVKKKIEESKEYLYGLIDTNGIEIVPVRYEKFIQLGFNSYKVMKNGLWGIYYSSTQIEVPCQYDEILNRLYQSGMYRISLNGKWGYIDPLGNIVISIIHEESQQTFTNGKLRVTLDNEFFMIDKKGERIEN